MTRQEFEGNVAVTTLECPTCAERGYDNADYHRLHRAWCDSVAEVERLRAAADEALNVLIGCCVPAGGCDDREAILRVQLMLRQALTVPGERASQASSS
jgi:hypothetical protein